MLKRIEYHVKENQISINGKRIRKNYSISTKLYVFETPDDILLTVYKENI